MGHLDTIPPARQGRLTNLSEEQAAAEVETAPAYDLTYLALGAGLDSTALLLCSEAGLHGVPRADLALFTDVGGATPAADDLEVAEPAYVLEHVWRLAERATATPGAIPIHVMAAQHGLVAGLRRRLHTGHGHGANPPLYTREAKDQGEDLFGDRVIKYADGQIHRQCTTSFKVNVAERYVRALLDVRAVRRRKDGTYPIRVRTLLGIAADEVERMKPSSTPWIDVAYPLVDAGLRKRDLPGLLRAHGWPVPEKSACVFCPYHGDDYWSQLRARYPDEFERACRFDEEFRRLPKMRGETFVHRSRKPLRMVRFGGTPDAFGNECSGTCAS
jgi:hypothetical protein